MRRRDLKKKKKKKRTRLDVSVSISVLEGRFLRTPYPSSGLQRQRAALKLLFFFRSLPPFISVAPWRHSREMTEDLCKKAYLEQSSCSCNRHTPAVVRYMIASSTHVTSLPSTSYPVDLGLMPAALSFYNTKGSPSCTQITILSTFSFEKLFRARIARSGTYCTLLQSDKVKAATPVVSPLAAISHLA